MAQKRKNTRKKKRSPVVRQSTKPAKTVFRLLPMTMYLAAGLLCLKSVEVYQEGARLHEAFLVGNVLAEEEAEVAAVDEEEAAAEEASEDAAETEGEAAEGDTAEAPPEPPKDMFEEKESGFTAREADILQSLSQRREKLEKWEREVALREKLLEATEGRIDSKIAEMNALNDKIEQLLVAYKDEENAKIRSLVKIYEAMKPKEAARIFNELDMDVLLMVVDRMSERRVAPVLASMSPQRAKEVTQQLADQQKLVPVVTPEPTE